MPANAKNNKSHDTFRHFPTCYIIDSVETSRVTTLLRPGVTKAIIFHNVQNYNPSRQRPLPAGDFSDFYGLCNVRCSPIGLSRTIKNASQPCSAPKTPGNHFGTRKYPNGA